MADSELSRKKDDLIQQVLSPCPEPVLESLRCPECGSEIGILVHPSMDTVAIYCKRSTVHLMAHRGMASAPEWWKKHISDGWLED